MRRSKRCIALYIILVSPLLPVVGLMWLADWINAHDKFLDKWVDWAARVAKRVDK